MGDIEDHLRQGGNPVVKVPGLPISGYGATNPQEGFCEALGQLVAYGPRSLLPPIRAALKILFPKLRVESRLFEKTEKKKGQIRASKLKYVHFTDAKGALGMVKEKKIWQSDYAGHAVYAVAVGGAYVPGVQLSKMGRAPKGRDVAILFTTDEFPDVLYPEEVMWHKKEIRIKTAKIIPASRAIKLLDGSLVKNDELRGVPVHPSLPDWDTGRVRGSGRKTVGRL